MLKYLIDHDENFNGADSNVLYMMPGFGNCVKRTVYGTRNEMVSLDSVVFGKCVCVCERESDCNIV